MKLLILTQKMDVNDPILGFFVRWTLEFAKHCESIVVICLYKGEHNLPKNIKVLSLGKERDLRERCDLKGGACDGKRSFLEEKIFSKIKYIYRFYKYIWQERKNYDSVFVHMNQIYIILGGIFWRLTRKKIALWYTHKSVTPSLRIAEKLTNYIFTASSKSFRLKSNKVNVLGHAIDTNYFVPKEKENDGILKIVTIGRISPAKNYEVLINAVNLLKKDFKLNIVGSAGTPEQQKYFDELKKNRNDEIVFTGAVQHTEVLKFLQKADVFVNMSNTGSLDKAVLEAMSVNLPVITSNEAFKMFEGIVMFKKNNTEDLKNKLENTVNLNLREVIVRDHGMEKTISKITNFYETSR